MQLQTAKVKSADDLQSRLLSPLEAKLVQFVGSAVNYGDASCGGVSCHDQGTLPDDYSDGYRPATDKCCWMAFQV